ncbi:MAG: sugar phosphate isomerase/epimerase [Ruminococcaceae bacterium]|nr:sugar phosphate isomerase/epimerase [Oscillospiraceae bacterium]
MKRKLGVVANCLTDKTEPEALDLIRAAGFEAVFSESNDPAAVYALRGKCDNLGLSLDFLHAPFGGINNFWLPGDAYVNLRRGIESSIDSAAGAGVPLVVCHVSSGWNPPPLCDVGLSRFDALVEYALNRGVKIAFENLRKLGVLAAIMERYEKIPEVGFCYDIGHEHCYTRTVHYMDLYADRLLCTHIHDNHGRDKDDWSDPDEHLLPFDGNIDYADIMRRLNDTDFAGTLMLEIYDSRRPVYREMGNEAFLKTAYERISQISKL